MNTRVFLAVRLKQRAVYVLSCYYKTYRQSTYIVTDNGITDDPVVSTENLYLKVSSCIILVK